MTLFTSEPTGADAHFANLKDEQTSQTISMKDVAVTCYLLLVSNTMSL